MLKSFHKFAWPACLAASLVLSSGCENKPTTQTPPAKTADDGHNHSEGDGHNHGDEHDHDHSNLSLADAVKEIDKLRQSIADALAANDADKAHDPLHEIGHIIEVVVPAATKAALPEAELTEAKNAADSLMDSFGKIDEGMHGGAETKYSDVAEKIDQAMATLKKLAKVE